MAEKKRLGLVQVYTGEGKGKTTAALGLALRAVGRGWRVCFIQFCKGQLSGEHLFLEKYPVFEILCPFKSNIFTAPDDTLKKEAGETLKLAEQKILSGNYDLVVLDEINIAVYRRLIPADQVLALLEKKPAGLEVVLTGRYAHDDLIKRADLVTEMKPVKHPFFDNIPARLGIEY
ncbi:MAG TPA: cob(I)yrinic acid a,c-diamide adenosyltransferase [Dehalococcoidales bacterium]|nr:cob(I)yrinic acid a,c-diamide adenosyltransferase [Dehalococcoidales bacterium]